MEAAPELSKKGKAPNALKKNEVQKRAGLEAVRSIREKRGKNPSRRRGRNQPQVYTQKPEWSFQ